MYNTILVPLDGSKRAERILPHVEKLAKSPETKVILLGVVETQVHFTATYGVPYELNVDLYEQREKDARTYLTSIQKQFQEKGTRAETLVEMGSVSNTIIEVAERQGVDLIAMTSHGRTGLARVFYGNVASGVLNRVDRPLLLIRSESDE